MEAARLTLSGTSMHGRLRLGALLMRASLVTAQQLEEALVEDAPDTGDQADLGVAEAPGEIVLYRAGGCGPCGRTGYRGRVALDEIMPIQGRIRRLSEFVSVSTGSSSFDEVRRVTGNRLA